MHLCGEDFFYQLVSSIKLQQAALIWRLLTPWNGLYKIVWRFQQFNSMYDLFIVFNHFVYPIWRTRCSIWSGLQIYLGQYFVSETLIFYAIRPVWNILHSRRCMKMIVTSKRKHDDFDNDNTVWLNLSFNINLSTKRSHEKYIIWDISHIHCCFINRSFKRALLWTNIFLKY